MHSSLTSPSMDGNAVPAQVVPFARLASPVRHVFGRWFFLNDCLALIAAYAFGALPARFLHMLWSDDVFQNVFHWPTLRHFSIYAVLGFATLLWFDNQGHYRQRLPFWETIGHIFGATLFGFIANGFVEFAVKSDTSRLWIGLSWILFAVFIIGGRALVSRLLDRRGLWRIHAVLIGDGPSASAVVRALQSDAAMGYDIVATLSGSTLHQLTGSRSWSALLRSLNAEHVFLALGGNDIDRHAQALKALTRENVSFSIAPPWLALPSHTLSPHCFITHDVMLLHNTNRLEMPLPRASKRFMDITVASVAIAVLLPVFAFVAFGVALDGGPVFFKQTRLGRRGTPFSCLKFRSMHANAEVRLRSYLAQNPKAAEEWARFQKLKIDKRITKFGRFIRRWSLDELPQLFNVVRGDMSLVGPRPCLVGQEELYAEDFRFYKSVRPGITGPWQVSGRNFLPFAERVILEGWYVRNWSLWTDFVILFKTIPTLLEREKAS